MSGDSADLTPAASASVGRLVYWGGSSTPGIDDLTPLKVFSGGLLGLAGSPAREEGEAGGWIYAVTSAGVSGALALTRALVAEVPPV